MKTVIASSLVLIVAAIALVLPWYPVTTSQVVPQTQSYTTQFEVPTTTSQMQTVYTLPNPVTIPGAQSIFIGLLSPWISRTFNLQAGLSVSVSVILPSAGYAVFIWENFPPYDRINFTMNGVLQGYTAVVPKSGSYYVTISNLNTTPITISALSVSEGVSETVQLTRTLTTYSTTSVTQYSQTTIAPYTTLGLTTSATVLILLALVLLLSILIDRGIINVSKHRKKQHGDQTTPKIEDQNVTKPSQVTPSKQFCMDCGSELSLDSKFCNKCGTKQS